MGSSDCGDRSSFNIRVSCLLLLQPLGLALLFLDVSMIVIFLLASPRSFPWFIYPIYASLLAYSIFFIAGSSFFANNRGIFIHGTVAALTSVMLVFTNEHAGRYPWCVYPVLSMGLAFAIHGLVAFRGTDKYELLFDIHAAVFSFVQCILFFAWSYGGTAFPWFLIPFFVGLAALVLHFLLWRQRQKRMLAQENQSVVPPTVEVVPNTHNDVSGMSGQYPAPAAVEPTPFSIQPYQQQPYQYQQQQLYPQPPPAMRSYQQDDVPVQQPQMYPSPNQGN